MDVSQKFRMIRTIRTTPKVVPKFWKKKKLEIFEVDFCNAVGTVNSSFQSLDLFNEGRPITIQVLFFFLVNSIFSLLGREKKSLVNI